MAAKSGALKDLKWGGLTPGTKLGVLAPVFPRADKGLVQVMSEVEANKVVPKSAFTDEVAPAAVVADATHPAAGAADGHDGRRDGGDACGGKCCRVDRAAGYAVAYGGCGLGCVCGFGAGFGDSGYAADRD